MSVLLFVIGAITLVLGALSIGFGIPVSEFSFGNTLIIAGTTGAIGGLIVIGLGAVVAQLQRVTEVIGTRAPLRPNRAPEAAEAARAPAGTRVPFPPKSSPEPVLGEAPPVEPPLGEPAAFSSHGDMASPVEAPTLPNPDVAPAEGPEAAEKAPPVPPFAAMPPTRAEPAAPVSEPVPPASEPQFGLNGSSAGEPEPEPEPLPAWLSAPRTPEPPPPASEEARFEALWPTAEPRAASQPEAQASAPEPAVPPALETKPEPEAPARKGRNVAILKSGVVDGMAYTLYVDGSIEAELPQGTLRFASINDLREHLEKTS